MNKFSDLRKIGGSLLSVVLVFILIGSATYAYRLDITRIMQKVNTIEKQNIITVEARKSEALRDFTSLMAQKAKIESIEGEIRVHQNAVDHRQREILELIAKINADQLKGMHDKQKEILDLLKTLEKRQIDGTYNVSKKIFDEIKELREAHKRIEEKLK